MHSLVKLSRNKFKIFKDIVRNCTTLQGALSLDPPIFQNVSASQSILKVAVVGMPNAGKSTFINHLIDRKVCPTSSKVHTTRTKACAIFTENNAQIIFLDTPGLVTSRTLKRHHLEKSFIKDSESSLCECDVIGVIQDVSNAWTRDKLDIKIIKLLEKHHTKSSFLVLNKVDILKSKRKLLDITRLITMNSIDGKPFGTRSNNTKYENRGWPNFKEVFMVSSFTGDGLSQVKNYLLKLSKPGKWLFSEDAWSDQTPEKIITNTVKATLLDFLPKEIPYQMEPEMELYEVNDEGLINAVVNVKCVSERVAKLVAGVSDGRLRQITESTQRSLQDVFHHFVRIRIVLQPPKESK
ncbi:hypothetical protein RN001_013875 [Aquatica leii]|uniref:GTPase Era, mitochondrial n=1 Tax=Aquatica leii TaxID=1421715 RepID=A0AAN7SNW7_9COLE|nr:hypothetical protein RN001_013875 [Aquatica leii]